MAKAKRVPPDPDSDAPDEDEDIEAKIAALEKRLQDRKGGRNTAKDSKKRNMKSKDKGKQKATEDDEEDAPPPAKTRKSKPASEPEVDVEEALEEDDTMQVDEEDADMLEVGVDEEDAVADGVAEDVVEDAEDAADEAAADEASADEAAADEAAADEADDDVADGADEDIVSLPGDNDAVEIPSAPLTDAETGDGETEVDVDMSEFNDDAIDLLTRALTHRTSKEDRVDQKLLDPNYIIPEDIAFEDLEEQFALDTDILQQGTIDQTELDMYQKLKMALMGLIILDFSDPEVMKVCLWNLYNGRDISDADARVIAEDFCKSSKRHYEHPMEAIGEEYMFLGRKPVKEFDTVDQLPIAKLDVEAMGKNKLIFCSGAHRVRAMQYYVEYLTRTQTKLELIIDKLNSILVSTPNSPNRIKLLETSHERLQVVQTRLKTGMQWTVRVSYASQLNDAERRALSKNKDTHEVPMKQHERMFGWREDMRETILNWPLTHPPPEPGPPRVGTPEWKLLFETVTAHDKHKMKERMWVLEQTIPYGFYNDF
ncbi:hypothetical protein VTO73DRAFT_2046, partial [Trametes versicolor]